MVLIDHLIEQMVGLRDYRVIKITYTEQIGKTKNNFTMDNNDPSKLHEG